MIRYDVTRPDGAVVSATIHPHIDDRDGVPLIFIPGWLCDAQCWQATAERLSSWRTCVTLDLPGFGMSAAGTRDRWSLADFGADVAALADALPGKRAVLVGHSMGGAVALEAAIAAPDHIERVVAIDSFVYPAFYDPTPENQIGPVVASFAEDFPATVEAAMRAYILSAPTIDVEHAVATMIAADSGRGLAVLRDFLRWDVDARLSETQVPVSIIASGDFLAPETTVRWRRHDLTCIGGVGHFIMLDDPASFDRALLDKISGSRA